MHDHIDRIITSITAPDDELAQALAGDIGWLAHAVDEEVHELLQRLVARLDDGAVVRDKLLAAVLRQLVMRAHSGGDRAWKRLSADSQRSTIELYRQLGPGSPSRHSLLQLLAVSRGEEELQNFAELIVVDPPANATGAALAFGPLLQHDDYDAESLFPRLLDALAQPVMAPLVMDLANYVTREELVSEHPATERREQLAALLGGLVQRLGLIEEQPYAVSQDDQELAAIVSQSVSLAVSTCDALALIGDAASIGKLNQVLELRHRRLATEAAAALARLGDENGKQVLVSMAAEPVARLRVLCYAEELGLQDQINEQFSTPAARAEAELALWLAEPTRLGFPPSRLELVDSQLMYWPGYDEPMDCFLLRFAYEIGESEYANIGIAGPLCHAFAADLADLPPDDIYAMFAGWQAEHEEIYEFDVNQLTEGQRVDVSRFERRLRDEGCVDIKPIKLGYFFGDKAFVARAVGEGQSGVAVATADEVQWLSVQGRRRPIGPEEAYCLFKGRRLLRAFNEKDEGKDEG